jgi:periplasmic protein TonB
MQGSVKYFFLLFIASFFIISCNSSDYGDKNTTSTIPKMSDSSTAVNNHSATNYMMDTIGTNTDIKDSLISGNMVSKMKDTAATKGMAKKNRKAKVMIEMPTAKYSARKIEMDKQGYYNSTEVLPTYPGGQKALENFFNNNLEYPQMATDNGTEGTVNISFLVDENGKISSPEVVSKKVGDGVEDEALRVFNRMPPWAPGQIKGKNVKTRFTLPVKFQLER